MNRDVKKQEQRPVVPGSFAGGNYLHPRVEHTTYTRASWTTDANSALVLQRGRPLFRKSAVRS